MGAGSLVCAKGVVGWDLVGWVHWSEPWVSSGALGVAGFIAVRHGSDRVRYGSLGS